MARLIWLPLVPALFAQEGGAVSFDLLPCPSADEQIMAMMPVAMFWGVGIGLWRHFNPRIGPWASLTLPKD